MRRCRSRSTQVAYSSSRTRKATWCTPPAPWLRRRQARLDPDVQLRRGAALAHLVNVDRHVGRVRRGVAAHLAHRHHPVRKRSEGARSGTLMVIGPRPRIWNASGTGLRSQGWNGHRCRHRPPASGAGLPDPRSRAGAARPPPAPGRAARPPRRGARSSSPAPRWPATRRPVRTMEWVPRRSRPTGQSKNVRSVPGAARAVRIEQVVGARIVLVDGLLDQPQPEHARVEVEVAARRSGDRRSRDGCRGCIGRVLR